MEVDRLVQVLLRGSILCTIFPLLGTAVARSQTLPSFEVASVKTADLNGPGGIGLSTYPGGRIRCSKCTLDILIRSAFDLETFQVSGGPRWMNDDRFDIEAKPPASSESSKSKPYSPKAPPNEEQRQMLQSLLADRFQLRWHRESKVDRIYLLQRGKKALRLEEPKDRNAYHWAGSNRGGGINGDGLVGVNISMPELAWRLTGWIGRPVLDQTGIKGSYDFKYQSSPSEQDERPDVIFTLIESVQAIGLKLEAGRGPVETVVIDRAEKPSAN